MKKNLLAAIFLFLCAIVYSQSPVIPGRAASMLNMKQFSPSDKSENNSTQRLSPLHGSVAIDKQHLNNLKKQSASPTSFTWELLAGSSNVNGMVVHRSRPLQYHPKLNAVTFIHRASDTYTASPALPATATTGVVLAEVSTDWGQTWDSTAIWANDLHWGRYPQGAIYNPAGNTNISNAYVVASGVSVGPSSFEGSWYASKQLNMYNNIASTVTGAQQFLSFQLQTYPPDQGPHGWSRVGFSSTDDGIVRSLAVVANNYTSTASVFGFAVVTGTFNGTAFDWRVDTLIPNTYLDPALEKHLNADGQMAFNQSGTIGYIVGIGALAKGTLANQGYQPIIYKMDRTQNANATWTLMPGIDFNSAIMRPVVKSTYEGLTGLNPLYILQNDTVGAPFVHDFDITVDARGMLHIGAVLMSTARENPDSLNYVSQFTTSINPTELYKWRHTAGHRPYLYDFVGDGTNFNYLLIDSISSEEPSPAVGFPGYAENPWDGTGTGNLKIGMSPRVHLGRTPDGHFITFSWAESDSGFTNNAYKWNNLPDLKVRALAVGLNPYDFEIDDPGAYTSMQNITENDNDVKSRATLHFMSPTTGAAVVYPGSQGSANVDINTPFTVTNSSPYSQETNNATWYGRGRMSYFFHLLPEMKLDSTVAISKVSPDELNFQVYPNPAKHSVIIFNPAFSSGGTTMKIINAVGQLVMEQTLNESGKNTIDTSKLISGFYVITVQNGNNSGTKKLLIE